MKLIRLNIKKKFRSLIEDFEIKFREKEKDENLSSFHPFCFAGLNGSGKSNVLEALSNIFYHLECIVNDYPVFAYDSKNSNPNEFELEYFIPRIDSTSIEEIDHILIIKKENATPEMSVNNGDFQEVSKSFGKSFLPDLVVAYSSGENETISLPYIKMKLFEYDEYLKDLRNNVKYERAKSSLLYVDYEMSQAALLTILLFFDYGEGKEKGVLDILRDEIKIAGMQQFSINLSNNWQEIIEDVKERNLIEVKTIYEKEDKKNYLGKILDNLEDYIVKFLDCSTCSFTKGNFSIYSFLIDDRTKTLFREKFANNPYEFFNFFQILHSLNERVEENEYKDEVYNSTGFYTDYKRPTYSHFFYFTHYYIKKIDDVKGNKIENLLLRQLSDGEQQFLHTLAICLMLQDKRALLLLDEPETHFNPEWRSKFIDILRRTLEARNENFLFKDIIITSHSPFIISDCFPDKVIVFEKNKNPESADFKNFRTFGTSVDIIMENIFNRNNTIGDFSAKIIYEIEEEIKNKKNLTEEQVNNYKKRTVNLGDSMEKILLFTKLNELKKK